MKKTHLCYTIFLLVFLLQNTSALRWSPTNPKDGELLYACTDHDVSLPWSYTLGTGDVIASIKWYFEGHSREMVAVSVDGNFFLTPAFTERVQRVSEAGLVLRHVTVEDAGNYSVVVTGHDRSGASFEERRTVVVQVANDLRTTDHQLHASQQAEAEHSNSSGQWHSVLTCGHFTFTADPPISVDWMTPEGHTLPSTVYSEGFFKLFLPNPVPEGNYTCTISASSGQSSCAHGHGRQASVVVNGLMSRLALMEAKQQRLEQQLQSKNAVINELTSKVETLEAELSHPNTLPHIVFSARLNIPSFPTRANHTLILSSTTINVGDAYSNVTGRFTAPVTGVYYLSAMVTSQRPVSRTELCLMTNVSTCLLRSLYEYHDPRYHEVNSQTGSLQGAVRLQQGEQVWLTSGSGYSHYQGKETSVFSGFLLFAE